jgi:hypothetical protein
MAKILLCCYPAESNETGISVTFSFSKGAPMPSKTLEVKRTDDALAALEQYKIEAAKTGLPLAITMRVIEGRKPAGFDAANKPHFRPVNC